PFFSFTPTAPPDAPTLSHTPLFRSAGDIDAAEVELREAFAPGNLHRPPHQEVRGARERLPRGGQVRGVRIREPASVAVEHGTGEDRKSTRLNSSHVAISYAVFCLKK